MLANHDVDGDGKISRKEYTSHMFRLKIIIIIIIMMIITMCEIATFCQSTMILSCSRDLSSEEIEERRKQFDSTLDVDHSGVAERRFFIIATIIIIMIVIIMIIIIIFINDNDGGGPERKLYNVVSSDRSSLVFTFRCRTI